MRRITGFTGPAILFAIVIGMFWKLVLTRQYTWLNSPDTANLVLPWFQLQAAELHRWSLVFWDPYQWCGQPLIAQGQAGTAYPINWLLWAMPLHHTWLRHVYLNWYFVLIHFQAALFAYWLCRDLGRSVQASLLGGLAFGLGPWLGTNEWPAALNAAVWAPLQLMYFLRAAQDRKPMASALACGAALGASWLSGDDQIPLLLTVAMAVLWIWLAAHRGRWKLLWAATATGLGVSAFQALPALEYLSLRPSVWSNIPATVWNDKALSPISFPGIVMPGYGDPVLFAGWTLLVVAAIGLWREQQNIAARVCGCVAAAGLLLSFGHYVMFGGILRGLHVLDKDPREGLALFAVGLAVLSAAGLDSLLSLPAPRASQVLAAIGAFCFALLFALELTQGDDVKKFTPLALCGVAALLLAALLEARAREAITVRAGGVCIILLAMWELGHVAGMRWVNIEFGWPNLDRLAQLSDLVQDLHNRNAQGRVLMSREEAPFDFGEWEGVEQFDGLTGGTQNIVRVADLPSARALAGVKYTIAKGPRSIENPDAAPRAWVVHEVDRVEGDAAVRGRLAQPPDQLMRRAFVRGAVPRVEQCADPGTVFLEARRNIESRERIRASLPCAGLVIVGQTWYPGWIAYVDGRRAPLLEAYGFLDAVPVPGGEHHIELVYRPWHAWIGALITLTTIAIVLSGRGAIL
jgi:hypothetical protein